MFDVQPVFSRNYVISKYTKGGLVTLPVDRSLYIIAIHTHNTHTVYSRECV